MEVLADFGGVSGPQIVFLLGLSLVIVILMMRSRRYFRQVSRHSNAPAPAISTTAKPRPSAAPPKSLEQWEVSMHELARDLSGQLDSKIRVLELLIREAGDTAARLESAIGKSRPAPVANAAPITRSDSSESESAPIIKPIRPAVPSARPSRTTVEPLKIAGNPRFERVYALADAGMSPVSIANQIGSQVGEVELILSLRSAS